jgi:hypothetical protein
MVVLLGGFAYVAVVLPPGALMWTLMLM